MLIPPATCCGSCAKRASGCRRRRRQKLRADSGFYSHGVVEWCEAEGFRFTITADQTEPLLAAITAAARAAVATSPRV